MNHHKKRIISKLSIILLESALELVPQSISNHPAVLKSARKRRKKPTEILLDVSIHYHAMKNLENKHKRGRPDIVHASLLEALESPLNKKGYLNVFIHTIDNNVIFIDPTTRIPRNYNRFVGLMEQLLNKGKVPPDSEKPLLYVRTMTIDKLLKELDTPGFILLREMCARKSIGDIVKQAIEEKLPIGIGGFPHGDFSEEIMEKSLYCYSIYDEPLSTLIVVSRIIARAEEVLGILI
ncbi:MAG: 16S rRNA methyltransferase [Desulfurococcaceae archaeon]